MAKRPAPPLDESGLSNSPQQAVEDRLVLSLSDLLPGDQGELVLIPGDNAPVDLLTSHAVFAQGVAENHITADGIDVTGLSFLSFATGITVYFPTDLSLTVSYEA